MNYDDENEFNEDVNKRFEKIKKENNGDFLNDSESTLDIFKKEREKRKTLYRGKINETLNVNASKTPNINAVKNFKEEVISNPKNILEKLGLYKRDKISFQILDGNQKFLDNYIFSISDDYITISNPFTIYANKIPPNKINCHIEEDGNEYSFTLHKKNSSDNGASISCNIPAEINILKRRGCPRVEDFQKSTVGLFLESREKEVIGYMRDLSESGIGFSFGETVIDNDSLSLIRADLDSKIPLLIENKGRYITILVDVKYTYHNKSEKTIEVGASFDYLDSDEIEDIKNIFNDLKEKSVIFNKMEKTKFLINSSKIGINI